MSNRDDVIRDDDSFKNYMARSAQYHKRTKSVVRRPERGPRNPNEGPPVTLATKFMEALEK